MRRSATLTTAEEKLTFSYVLNQLHNDEIISDQQYAQILKLIPRPDESIHPLILLADQGLKSNTVPPFPLTLEKLTNWLANKTGYPYFRIDPLKIDVNTYL